MDDCKPIRTYVSDFLTNFVLCLGTLKKCVTYAHNRFKCTYKVYGNPFGAKNHALKVSILFNGTLNVCIYSVFTLHSFEYSEQVSQAEYQMKMTRIDCG